MAGAYYNRPPLHKEAGESQKRVFECQLCIAGDADSPTSRSNRRFSSRGRTCATVTNGSARRGQHGRPLSAGRATSNRSTAGNTRPAADPSGQEILVRRHQAGPSRPNSPKSRSQAPGTRRLPPVDVSFDMILRCFWNKVGMILQWF